MIKLVRTNVFWMAGAIALALGLISYSGLFAIGKHVERVERDRSSWPHADGAVKRTHLGRSGNVDMGYDWTLTVHYDYEVEGSLNSASQGWVVEVAGNSFGSKQGEAEERKFPAGRQVSVLFDPSNPEKSVIDPTKVSSDLQSFTELFAWVGLAAGIAAIVFLYSVGNTIYIIRRDMYGNVGYS